MYSPARTALRILAVSLLGAAAIAYSAPDIILPVRPFGTFGFDADPTSGVITVVRAQSAASAAGLQPTEVIDLQATPASSHKYVDVYSFAAPGTIASFVVRGQNGPRTVTLTASVRPRSLADNVTDVILVLAQVCFILIAAALVLMRPSLMMWAFYVYGLSTVLRSVVMLEALNPMGRDIFNGWTTLAGALGWVGLVVFALRFPNDKVSGWRATLEKTILAVGAAALAYCLYLIIANIGNATGAAATLALVNRLLVQVSLFGFLLGIALFVASYVGASERDRPRMAWVLFGFALGYGSVLLVRAFELYFSVALPLWAVNALLSLNVAVPITVAYAVVRYRVIDVRFFLDRALVYGALTTLAVGLIALLHSFVSHRVEGFHVGIPGELGFALAIGLGLRYMHAWIEGLANRFVFRAVRDADAHLGQTAASMLQARARSTIDVLLSQHSSLALHLSSVAVFRRSEDDAALAAGDEHTTYRRVAATGWSDAAAAFGEDDELVLALKAAERSIASSAYLHAHATLPSGDAAPILAIPFVIRHEVEGFALFGAHRSGAGLDPDERRLLESFCARAAIAYDQVGVIERDAELARRQGELAQLRSENDLLRSIAGARRRGPLGATE